MAIITKFKYITAEEDININSSLLELCYQMKRVADNLDNIDKKGLLVIK